MDSMLRSLRCALALLAFAAVSVAESPAAAQTFTLPEIGLQNSGACRQLAVRERDTQTMVPIGCIDTPTKSWTLMPNKLFSNSVVNAGTMRSSTFYAEGSDTADLYNLRTSPPDNGFWTRSGGPLIDYCAAAGCILDGPYLKAQSYFRATTKPHGNAQQVGIAADFWSTYGHLPKWKPNTVYRTTQPSVPAATSEVHTGDAFEALAYVNTVDNCTSGNTPPTGTGTNISDGGTCRWNYTGLGLSSGGTGVAFNTRVKPGGGNTWGMITNMVIEPGVGDGIYYGQEFDCDNRNKPSFAGSSFGFSCLYLGGGGPNNFPSLAGIYIDNSLSNDQQAADPYGYEYGFVVAGQPGTRGSVVRQGAYTDWSNAQYSFWALGDRTHQAFLRDDSKSTTVLSVTNTHTVGLDFSQATITGKIFNSAGFNIFSDGGTVAKSLEASGGDLKVTNGNLRVTNGLAFDMQYTVAGMPPCGAGTKGGRIVVTDIASAITYRATGFSGGGSSVAPAFCNGSSWELH